MKKIKSLGIGKVILSILSENEELNTMLGDNKIFPLIVNTDTQFPFIVYKRLNINTSDSKDKFICLEKTEVQFAIVTTTYNKGVDIGTKLIDILSHIKYSYDDIEIVDAVVTAVEEDYAEEAYTQIINIQFYIQ